MDSENCARNPPQPTGNGDLQPIDYPEAQRVTDDTIDSSASSYQINAENVNGQQLDYDSNMEVLNKEDGMDLDLPVLRSTHNDSVPVDQVIPDDGFQGAECFSSDLDLPYFDNTHEDSALMDQDMFADEHQFSNQISSDYDLDEISMFETAPSSGQTSTLQTIPDSDEHNSHFGTLENVELEQDLPPYFPIGNIDESSLIDLNDGEVCTSPDLPSSDLIATQDGDLQPVSKKVGTPNGQGDSISSNYAGQTEVVANEGSSEMIQTSPTGPILGTAAEQSSSVPSSVVEGKKLEVIEITPEDDDPSATQNSKIVVVDKREEFYSGNIRDSKRNEPMRFIKESALVKKASTIIKSSAAATIRNKIPDMPIMPRISRTTTQIFFAFLYLLTQRDWAKYHSDRLSNKMGFFEDLLDWFEYPSSIRHLVTKTAFLKQLHNDMCNCAYQYWKDENPGLSVKEKKDGKEPPVWRRPPPIPNCDKEHSEYNDVTVPFYVWHIREDYELLALSDLVLKKTNWDEKNDVRKAAKGMEPTRLSLRARELFRLVADPDKLFDKIHELRLKIDDMVIDMEASAPIDLMDPENEQEFIDLYTYFLPKSPEETAAIRAEEKARLELEKATVVVEEAIPEVEEEADDLSPVAFVPRRNKKSTGISIPTCKSYPIPPSMRMQLKAQKAGQESKRPLMLSQTQQTSSKIKKKNSKEKKKQKTKQVFYEKPERASKLRASEKLAQSFAAYPEYVAEEDGENEYDNMDDFSYDAPQTGWNAPYDNNAHVQNSYSVPEEDYDTLISQEQSFGQEPGDLHSTQTSLPQDEYMDEPQYSKPRKVQYDDEDYDDQEYDDQYDDDQYDDDQFIDGFVEQDLHHSSHSHPGYGKQQTHHQSGFAQPGYGQQLYPQPGYGHQGYSQPGYSQPVYHPQSPYHQSMMQPGYHIHGQYQPVQHPQQIYNQHAYAPQGYGQGLYIQQPYSQELPAQHAQSQLGFAPQHSQNQSGFIPQSYGQLAHNPQAYSQTQGYEKPMHSQTAAYCQNEEEEFYDDPDQEFEQPTHSHPTIHRQESEEDESDSDKEQRYQQPKPTYPATHIRTLVEGLYDDHEDTQRDQYHGEEEQNGGTYPQTHAEDESDWESSPSSPLSERSYHDTSIGSLSQQQTIPEIQPYTVSQPNTSTPEAISSFQNNYTSYTNHQLQTPTTNDAFSSPHATSSQEVTPSSRKIIKLKVSTKKTPYSATIPFAPKPAHANLPTTSQQQPNQFLPSASASNASANYPPFKNNTSKTKPKLKITPPSSTQSKPKPKTHSKPKAGSSAKHRSSTAGNKKNAKKPTNPFMDDVDDMRNFIEPDDSDDEDFTLGGDGGGSGKKRKRSSGGGVGGRKRSKSEGVMGDMRDGDEGGRKKFKGQIGKGKKGSAGGSGGRRR